MVLEDQLRSQFDAGSMSLTHDLQTENRITAEIEKVVMHSYPFDTQHILPDVG